jgi:hypothetical protein
MLPSMLSQYRKTHNNSSPAEIVVTPLAAVVLAMKKCVIQFCDGVRVVGKDFKETEAVAPGTGSRLGVFVRQSNGEMSLVSCDLR